MFSNPPALRDAAAAVALVAAFGACALATVTDVTSRRIPNIACIVVLAGGGAWALAATRSGTTLISLAIAGGLLAWGTWMHSAKVLGGGDVKMLVAITAWLPLDTLSTFVLWGGLGSLLTAGFVRLIGWIQKKPTGPEGASVPMGLAFFCGMLAVFRPLLERTLP
jgi:prepilin peptidase CpaA